MANRRLSVNTFAGSQSGPPARTLIGHDVLYLCGPRHLGMKGQKKETMWRLLRKGQNHGIRS